MKENTPIEKNNNQCYVRFIRYLRKTQEAKKDEASHNKKTDSNKPK